MKDSKHNSALERNMFPKHQSNTQHQSNDSHFNYSSAVNNNEVDSEDNIMQSSLNVIVKENRDISQKIQKNLSNFAG